MASDEEFNPRSTRSSRRTKRRKTDHQDEPAFSLQPLLETVFYEACSVSESDYEGTIKPELPSLELSRDILLAQRSERDVYGNVIRPLTRAEELRFPKKLPPNASPLQKLAARKLQAHQNVQVTPQLDATPLPPQPAEPPVPEQVVDALSCIETTPFLRSFQSRLFSQSRLDAHAIAVDWDTKSDWMNLMCDVRLHHQVLHPDREQPVEAMAPIIYTTLQRSHLPQIHDLLRNIFWEGIDVTDSLDYSPERSTIVATYKSLVVGVAIMSSPVETYITYLAVRSGWENAHIATSMLYHLCQHNPHRDVTLHVSTTNPAMTLYNRFGFKAEGFVSGFYEKYLDAPSRGSRNAFQLRLRR